MITPDIEQATTFTAIIAAEPAVILLPRLRSVHIEPSSGALVSADAWTTAVTEHGARPMRDLNFDAATAPGWTVTLDRGMTAATITGPAELGEIYTGEIAADAQWRRQLEQRRRNGAGLVVITGPAERIDPDAALEMMEQGRAVWVRAEVALS